jgi:predicted GNAT family N-acyltransferase
MTPSAPRQQTFSRGSPAKLTDQPKLIVKPLENEDRAAFRCGEEALDRYFLERASRDMANKLSAVFIVVPENAPKTIVGFFTLSSQQTDCENLPEKLRKKTGGYKSVGVTLLGRMAVSKEYQKQKLGRFVLFAALREAWKSTKHVSSFAVIVDAKTDLLIPFYEKYGFHKLEGNRLMLPMMTIENLFGASEAERPAAATPASWAPAATTTPTTTPSS